MFISFPKEFRKKIRADGLVTKFLNKKLLIWIRSTSSEKMKEEADKNRRKVTSRLFILPFPREIIENTLPKPFNSVFFITKRCMSKNCIFWIFQFRRFKRQCIQNDPPRSESVKSGMFRIVYNFKLSLWEISMSLKTRFFLNLTYQSGTKPNRIFFECFKSGYGLVVRIGVNSEHISFWVSELRWV